MICMIRLGWWLHRRTKALCSTDAEKGRGRWSADVERGRGGWSADVERGRGG